MISLFQEYGSTLFRRAASTGAWVGLCNGAIEILGLSPDPTFAKAFTVGFAVGAACQLTREGINTVRRRCRRAQTIKNTM